MSAKKILSQSSPFPTTSPEPGAALSETDALLALAAPVAPAPGPAVKARLLARIRAAQMGVGCTPAIIITPVPAQNTLTC
ncbi:MAG: hypothetical protein H7343_05885 [Undibacterium sp.]|nr:hypothetical protein [Opitutaceae bacterium]